MASWGSIPCGVAFFGDDPRPNLPKLCSCLHSLPWQLGKHTAKKKWSTDIPYTKLLFFLAAGFLVEDPGVFFGHPEFQVVFPYKICRIWGQKVWWMVWTKPSPGLILFWWPLFWMPTKRGPRLAKGYGCTINPTQKCGFFAPWSQLPIKWQPCWESRVSLFNREIAFFFGGVLIRVCYISLQKL